MPLSLRTAFGLAFASVALVVTTAAYAAEDVTVTLTAHRVERVDGRETLRAAETARPGDLIEYHARYRNASAAPVRQVAATLPVPNGLEYVAESAAPTGVLASLDGKTYAPVPLKRRVRLADGREVVRNVPTSEYRYLRWTLGTLGVRADRLVRARMRVIAEPIAVNAR